MLKCDNVVTAQHKDTKGEKQRERDIFSGWTRDVLVTVVISDLQPICNQHQTSVMCVSFLHLQTHGVSFVQAVALTSNLLRPCGRYTLQRHQLCVLMCVLSAAVRVHARSLLTVNNNTTACLHKKKQKMKSIFQSLKNGACAAYFFGHI